MLGMNKDLSDKGQIVLALKWQSLLVVVSSCEYLLTVAAST